MSKDVLDRSTDWIAAARLFAAWGLSLSIACGDDAERATRIEITGYTPPAEQARPDPLYDSDGRLRESPRSAAGVRLPVGLRRVPSGADRVHAFESSATIDSLRQYFGSRVVSGNVEPLGQGVLFHNAVPIAQQGSLELDIMIAPVSADRARIELRELAPPPEKLPTVEETRRAVERAMMVEE